MTWAPDPSPDRWERSRRRQLGEEGLEHLRRFWTLAERHVESRKAVADLIADAGGRDPDPPGSPEGAERRGWTPELVRFARRRFRNLERTFRGERDGVPLGEREGVPLDRLPPEVADRMADAFTSLPVLRERVAEARAYADALEAAVP